ncbi:MAG: hypothetical protein J7L10_04300 [Methanomicrobia archaeon]|nr:hypothetical protein [Methanomicrobia archaeon]RLF96318.1 MAG: hypothetical protein DRN50_01900 [Thermococci archaeon]RLG01658.1 MAG: hypothetical protein DRN58_01300 [Thermococci archaeon]HHF09561.1 hypothetical protein [Methanomicrobia archaeon]
MSDIIETKITKIGNSLWALIPKEAVRKKKLKEGQQIKISIINSDRQRALKETFGLFKGGKEFKREDHGDREF